MQTNILNEPIFVGRTQELEELQVSLKAAFDGKGTTVFISGEAGSGKTRLANEFLNFARNLGIIVLSGWCLSNAAIPYFPFVEALNSYLITNEIQTKFQGGQQLQATTWHTGTEIVQAMSPQAWKDKTFAAVTKELLLLSTSRPLILFIDDLQWADSASLSLLHYVSRSICSERILILTTFRSEEVNSDLEGHGHELVETMRLMGREDLFKEIQLKGLSQSNVGDIAESMLKGKVNGNFIENLTAESFGIPLFVVESLRMLFEQGSLVQVQDQWRLIVEKYNIPSKVMEVILRRVEALKYSQKRVLEVASIIGEKFDPKLVGAVLSQDSLEVLETLNAISERTLLVHSEGNYYRFDHAKSREMLYDSIPTLLKKEIHARIAEKIECLSRSLNDFSASDLAYHFGQAGDNEKAIKYSLEAGKDALAKFSNTEAIKYFTCVLQNSRDTIENNDLRITAFEGLGDAFYYNMMFKEAAKTFETLAKIGGAVRMRALRKAMEASFFQNDIPHLIELIKEADMCDSLDRLERARILMNKGRVFVMQGRLTQGAENFEKALRVFEEEYSVWDTAWDLIALGSNLAVTGQLEEALAAAFRSIALFQELEDSRWLIEAYNMAGLTCVAFYGFWQEGMGLFEKAAKINEDAKIGDYLRLAQLNAQWAWALSSTGDLEGALSKSLKALNYAERTDSDWAKGMVYSNLVNYYTILGDIAQAGEYFGKLMKLPPDVLLNPNLNTPLATAIFFAGKNQWEESMRVFHAIFESFKKFPVPGVEAIDRLSYAWALGRQGRTEEAKKQVEEAQKFYCSIEKRFEHVNIQANLMVPAKVVDDQIFEVRLDLVNVSRGHGSLVRVEGITPRELKVVAMSKGCIMRDGSIELKDTRLEPFGVTTVKLSLQSKKFGVFKFNPQIIYVSDLGETKISKTQSISISVTSPPLHSGLENTAQIEQGKIEFKSEASWKVFDFLVKSFKEDYIRGKLPQERSGWRTFMDIVKLGKVSKYSIYGSSGGRGQAIVDLEKQGLVEIRVFTGERGRGGKVFKVRVALEKEVVKRQLDQKNC